METRGRIARLREFGCEDPVLDATLEEMAIAMELGFESPARALGIGRKSYGRTLKKDKIAILQGKKTQ